MARCIQPGTQFASDNTSGACREAWDALCEANAESAPGYGTDRWTRGASDKLREVFEADAEVFFCFTGTAANSMSIAHLAHSFESVICHEFAHVETDECGGPEFFTHGSKLLLTSSPSGKMDPTQVRRIVERRTDIHYPRPAVLSLTQSTELGTVYSAAETGLLCEVAHGLGLRVHMDGARFANAVAATGASPAELTWKAGVDVLCLGGTKNGLPVGEAVVFFDRDRAEGFDYRCKQAGQLASKMRFIAAPWLGVLRNDAWLDHARHANAMADRLAAGLGGLEGIELIRPREANAVFVTLDPAIRARLREKGWVFYDFIGDAGSRLMCSWATRVEEVDALVEDAREASRGAVARNPSSG